MFFLARHTAIVGHNRFAFWADALPTAAHRVLAISFGHIVSRERRLGTRFSSKLIVLRALINPLLNDFDLVFR